MSVVSQPSSVLCRIRSVLFVSVVFTPEGLRSSAASIGLMHKEEGGDAIVKRRLVRLTYASGVSLSCQGDDVASYRARAN